MNSLFTKANGGVYHVMRYSVTSCLRQSSRGQALSYAAREGCTEKYFDAGTYCQVVAGRAKLVGSSFALEKVAFAVKRQVDAGKKLE